MFGTRTMVTITFVSIYIENVDVSSFCTDPTDYECKHLGITKCVPKFNRSTHEKRLPIEKPPCAVPCPTNHSWCEERGSCIIQEEECDCGSDKIYCTSKDAYSCESRKGILQSNIFNICQDGTCRKDCSLSNSQAERFQKDARRNAPPLKHKRKQANNEANYLKSEDRQIELCKNGRRFPRSFKCTDGQIELCKAGQFRCGTTCLDNSEIVNLRTCRDECISVHQACYTHLQNISYIENDSFQIFGGIGIKSEDHLDQMKRNNIIEIIGIIIGVIIAVVLILLLISIIYFLRKKQLLGEAIRRGLRNEELEGGNKIGLRDIFGKAHSGSQIIKFDPDGEETKTPLKMGR